MRVDHGTGTVPTQPIGNAQSGQQAHLSFGVGVIRPPGG